MSGEEGFLARWSRRKRAAEAGAPDPHPDQPAVQPPPEPAAPPAEAPPAFDLASLPPVESLGPESDFSVFLRQEVPAALRRAALRRAWVLDPGIRDFIGPADYAWDYNAVDGVPGFALELGGDVKRLLAQAIGMLEEGEEAAPSDPAPEPPPPPASLAEAPAAAEPPPAEQMPAEPEPQPAPRRHGSAMPA